MCALGDVDKNGYNNKNREKPHHSSLHDPMARSPVDSSAEKLQLTQGPGTEVRTSETISPFPSRLTWRVRHGQLQGSMAALSLELSIPQGCVSSSLERATLGKGGCPNCCSVAPKTSGKQTPFCLAADMGLKGQQWPWN